MWSAERGQEVSPTKKLTDDADPTQRSALTALTNKLRRWEKTNEVYQEMCASADRRVAARKMAANHG